MSRSILLIVLALTLLCLVSGQNDAKTKKLVQLSKENGVVKMDSNAYFQYTQGKRDYGLVVLLTALGDQIRCVPCREFDPEYKLVASSVHKSKHSDQVFFGHLDFQDGQAVYQQLAIQTAPNVFYFPPSATGDNKEPIKYDLSRNGFAAEPLAEFIKHQSGISFNVTRPFDYGQFIAKVILGLGVLATIKLVYRHFAFILFHKNTWAAITIVTVIVMTSGHMFNRIRNTPYAMPGPNGQLSYVANGFSSQFGIETQLVASIYAVLAFAVVSLATFVPRFEDKWRQRVGVYIWSCCFIVIFSCLMALFKIKNGAYPFKVLF
ncbi:hypothetical protein BCR42DRAFT_411396 [Absidia repens]|uniref:Uncharacterized protein n=1 Tax=Absidia repens TaxID=90262 RepID=A0A1X2ILM1_9FUNG|nr:hypothetical protein BCR42DRAFT_411396 [Absidia repens]